MTSITLKHCSKCGELLQSNKYASWIEAAFCTNGCKIVSAAQPYERGFDPEDLPDWGNE